MGRYIVGITGASGVIYGIRLVDELLKAGMEIELVVSRPAVIVMGQEMGWPVAEDNMHNYLLDYWTGSALTLYDNNDIAAPIASGSYLVNGMLIVPCTMATAAAVAMGASRNLIERSADVMLKERRPLIVMPRETPLSSTHLRNLLALSDAGAHVIPAMPGFYTNPRTIDDMVKFMVGKVLDSLAIPHQLFGRYTGK